MSVSLPILNAVNLREIEMLKLILGIKYETKTESFLLTGSFSIKKLMTIYAELKNSVWKSNNIKMVVEELEYQEPTRSRIHYFGNGRPMALDAYISKMGLLDHEILVEDPLCFPLSVKPSYDGHITKQPELYIKHIFENTLSMIYLEEWIRKGYVYFIPSLPLIDIDAFWELCKLNEDIAFRTDFEKTAGFIKALKYSLVEVKIGTMLEFSRLTQINYTIAHIKKIFPQITDDEARKRLEMLKKQTLEEREESVVRWALDKSQLTEGEELSLLSHYERTRPFNIERFINTSKIKGGLHASTGMPLLHATYLSERFHCIPSTDNLGLMYNYEAWCQVLHQNLDPKFEKIRTKVDLPFSFLDKMPLNFVQKAREQGKANTASRYLDTEWSMIRQSHDLDSYGKAAKDFSTKISADFNQLSSQNELMLDELRMDILKSGYKGLSTLVAFNLVADLPLAIIGTLSTIIASNFDTVKTFRRSKNELQAKPLAIFLEAKNTAKKIKK